MIIWSNVTPSVRYAFDFAKLNFFV